MSRRFLSLFTAAVAIGAACAAYVDPKLLDACPGYSATNVTTNGGTMTASLALIGTGCNVFGQDVPKLSLQVTYETETRIHVKITDASAKRYEVPDSVLQLPAIQGTTSSGNAAIQFKYTSSPFSFSIVRTKTSEVLFNTASHPLIFEPQYLRVKTSLPANANIYGLGEHTNTFRLPTHDFTRTLWSRDAYGVSPGTNLYGNHPVYFEHRNTGTHGVFLRNSNGMDIKINDTETASTTTLEYNVIGGVLDFYFLAGSQTDPIEVARQYADLVGRPAELPYWAFGFHQCRFGYNSFVDVADVITNYSAAGIPMETMWTDIDYMDRRRIFTVDPKFFPLPKMREIVSYLHSKGQKFVLMTDPAVPYLPGQGYGPYDRGAQQDIFLKAANGSQSIGVVWPGVTVFPDWFHPKIQDFWTGEFQRFYDPTTGIDIDGAWIDMNEPASFCNAPCTDPFGQAAQQGLPPVKTGTPPDPNTPIFGHSKRDILNPPYHINNNAGSNGILSDRTASVDNKHANGLTEYDTHNLYGTMMSVATRKALLARRPGKRTLVITRSTFAGAGSFVGKWLGDNFSQWEQYRFSIAGMLGMASIYQVPMVGSDICGYAGDTNENLCARWATLGAFYPFMRNHNSDNSISQEFYRWASVTQAAKNVIDIRYRLMDYMYTAFHQAHLDGTPVLNPLFYKYPQDASTYNIDLQFFYGDSILVSPVTQDNSNSVPFYLPKDIFYDFKTLAPVQGNGMTATMSNVPFTEIPLHIRGGSILPLRSQSAMTTNELRKEDFELVVAPGSDGKAAGKLYLDDGESIAPSTMSNLVMHFASGKLEVAGTFGYNAGNNVARVRFLNVSAAPREVKLNGATVSASAVTFDSKNKVLDIKVSTPLTQAFTVEIS